MNNAKHPKFTKDLNNPTLHDACCPVSEVILETFAAAGFETAEPIYTVDGDRVRILAIDCQHQYPVVGEVLDFGAETTWLGRWTASGVYASSERQAVRKHSLKPNAEVGALFRDPGLPELTITIADYLRKGSPRYGSDEVEERAADFGRRTTTPFVPFDTLRAATDSVLRPQPQMDRAGSGGRVRSAGESEYDAAFAEAVKRDEKAARAKPWDTLLDPNPQWSDLVPVTREAWAGLKVNPNNGAPAKLNPVHVRAGMPTLDVSKQLIANAQDIIRKWSADHEADPHLHLETAKHVDLPELAKFYSTRCDSGNITHDAHLWLLAATYCIAGRILIKGPVENVRIGTLYYLTARCNLNPSLSFVYFQRERMETVVGLAEAA